MWDDQRARPQNTDAPHLSRLLRHGGERREEDGEFKGEDQCHEDERGGSGSHPETSQDPAGAVSLERCAETSPPEERGNRLDNL